MPGIILLVSFDHVFLSVSVSLVYLRQQVNQNFEGYTLKSN
jgi:hypothetical protein